MSTLIGLGVTPLVIQIGQYASLETSSDAVGTISIPAHSVADTVSGADTLIYGGYTAQTEITVRLTQGSLRAIFTDIIPTGAAASTFRQVTLSGDRTLSAADDGTYFTAPEGTVYTVTIPTGLGLIYGCVFAPPLTGSITLHPTGGAMLNGGTTDLAISIAIYSTPASLSPTAITDNYGVPIDGGTFAGLTDDPRNNTLLAGYLDALVTAPPSPAKITGAYTVLASDNGAFIWLSAQGVDKIVTFPAALAGDSPFMCFIGYVNLTAAAGRCNIKAGGSGTLNTTVAQSTGALATLTTGVYMGAASTNNIAVCAVFSEGATPGSAFVVAPLCGTFATS